MLFDPIGSDKKQLNTAKQTMYYTYVWNDMALL